MLKPMPPGISPDRFCSVTPPYLGLLVSKFCDVNYSWDSATSTAYFRNKACLCQFSDRAADIVCCGKRCRVSLPYSTFFTEEGIVTENPFFSEDKFAADLCTAVFS